MLTSVYDSLEEAISDCSKVFATSVRRRNLSWPVCGPKRALREINELSSMGEKVVVVFGRGSSGLSNKELDPCHGMIQIRTNSEFLSLNLASTVQTICYKNTTKLKLIQRQPPDD